MKVKKDRDRKGKARDGKGRWKIGKKDGKENLEEKRERNAE